MDVAGNVVDSLYGAGTSTTQITNHAAYDPNSGYLMYMKSTSGSTTYQDLAYQWYAIGNLYTRASNPTTDNANTLSETFTYDLHNRLLSSTVTNGAGTQTPLAQTYDSVGDISSKSDVGTYGYTGGTGGPHAVKTAGTNTYAYDANGNMASRSVTVNGIASNETMTWNSDNQPTAIYQDASNYSDFSYAPDKHRYKQVAMNAGSSETTLYVGGLDIITDSSGTWYRHTISAYGKPVMLETLSSNTSGAPKEDKHYLLNDHLGSVDTVVRDSDSTVVPRESFDAFGQRRDKGTWYGAMNVTDLANARKVTHRGFTHHEHLDNLAGLVHANGRVLDSVTGRFLSVDPVYQAPSNTQSVNPYSYVMNNSLSLVDPSGYCGTTTNGSNSQCPTTGSTGSTNDNSDPKKPRKTNCGAGGTSACQATTTKHTGTHIGGDGSNTFAKSVNTENGGPAKQQGAQSNAKDNQSGTEGTTSTQQGGNTALTQFSSPANTSTGHAASGGDDKKNADDKATAQVDDAKKNDSTASEDAKKIIGGSAVAGAAATGATVSVVQTIRVAHLFTHATELVEVGEALHETLAIITSGALATGPGAAVGATLGGVVFIEYESVKVIIKGSQQPTIPTPIPIGVRGNPNGGTAP